MLKYLKELTDEIMNKQIQISNIEDNPMESDYKYDSSDRDWIMVIVDILFVILIIITLAKLCLSI